MSANNPELRFPAWMHDNRWSWKLMNDQPLRIATEKYLRRSDRLAERILDTDLNLFKVVEIREQGLAGIFGWRPGFKGRHLRVETVLQFDRQLSLDAAKKYVIDFLSAHPEVYSSGMPPAQMLSTVMSAASTEELLASL